MKTLSRVIKDLLNLDEKKIASWNPQHKKVYYQLLGKRHSVGIEIESSTTLSLDQLKLLEQSGFVISWLNFRYHDPDIQHVVRLTHVDMYRDGINKWSDSDKVESYFRSRKCTSFEVTYLFDVTDPLNFIKDLKKMWALLVQLKVDTYGIHINVQAKIRRQSFFELGPNATYVRTGRILSELASLSGHSLFAFNSYSLGDRRVISPFIKEHRKNRYNVVEFKCNPGCLLANSLLQRIIICANSIRNYVGFIRDNYRYYSKFSSQFYVMNEPYKEGLIKKSRYILQLCEENFPKELKFLHYQNKDT